MTRTRYLAGAGTFSLIFLIAGPALAQKQEVTRTTASTNSGFGFGARALGMGGAFIAIADDASAASWNPAGIGQLVRPEFTIVGSMNESTTSSAKESILERKTSSTAVPTGEYDRYVYSDAELKTRQQGIDFLSYVQPFAMGNSTISAQFSYARLFPAGTGTQSYSLQWSDNYYVNPPQEALYSKQDITATASGSGGIDTYTLGLAAAIGPTFYAGFSGQLWTGEIGTTVHVKNSAFFYENDDATSSPAFSEFSDLEYSQLTKRKINGFSFNFGVLWVPNNWLRAGAVYRTKWSGSDSLEASYERTRQSTTSRFHATGAGQTDSDLEWPASWGVGLAVRPAATLTLSADYSITYWSQAKTSAALTGWDYNASTNSYTPTFAERAFPSNGPVEQNGEDYQNDQTAYRFGAEYVFRTGKALVPVRAGYYKITALAPLFTDRRFDQNPDAKFTGYTGGVGIAFDMGNGSSLLIDFAGVFEETDSTYLETNHFVCYSNCTEFVLRDSQTSQTIRNSRFIGSLIYRF